MRLRARGRSNLASPPCIEARSRPWNQTKPRPRRADVFDGQRPTGTVTATSTSVTVFAAARILPIVGIDSVAMTADATARPETAVLSL